MMLKLGRFLIKFHISSEVGILKKLPLLITNLNYFLGTRKNTQ